VACGAANLRTATNEAMDGSVDGSAQVLGVPLSRFAVRQPFPSHQKSPRPRCVEKHFARSMVVPSGMGFNARVLTMWSM
jgi:hypothetical protein